MIVHQCSLIVHYALLNDSAPVQCSAVQPYALPPDSVQLQCSKELKDWYSKWERAKIYPIKLFVSKSFY